MDNRLKSLVSVGGVLLLLVSLLAFPTFCCAEAWILSTAKRGPTTGVLVTTTSLLMLVCGGLVAYHGNQAILGKPSPPLKLPATWALISLSVLGLILEFVVWQSTVCGRILLLPCVAVAALLSPVAALGWMVEEKPELTWRRASVAFAAGTTVVAAVVFLLGGLLSGIIFLSLLTQRPGQFAFAPIKSHLLLTPPYLLFTVVVLVVIRPLVEELVKPWVSLPLLRQIEQKREAFLLGAAVGAGLATLENLLYAAAAGPFGMGVLIAQALGAAVQPLGAGLVTLGWHALLRREPDGKQHLATNYGLAFGLHALWNGTVLLNVVLSGKDSPDTALKVILTTLLIVEGVTVWVVAQAIARWLIPAEQSAEEKPAAEEKPPAEGTSGAQVMSYLLALAKETPPAKEESLPEKKQPTKKAPSLETWSPDRSVAVWALVCALVLLPLGFALLQILWDGIS